MTVWNKEGSGMIVTTEKAKEMDCPFRYGKLSKMQHNGSIPLETYGADKCTAERCMGWVAMTRRGEPCTEGFCRLIERDQGKACFVPIDLAEKGATT